MTIKPCLMAFAACAVLASASAFAHDGGHHDEEKAIPKTCAELADTKRFTNDEAYPEVKKLKAQCEAEAKKAAAPKP